MSSVITSFNYQVEASFIIDDQDYPIADGSINSIVIDYSYDNKNMPGMYVALRIPSDLYNKMVLNSETGVISLRLYKFNSQLQNPIVSPYIQDKFIYLISSDPNYNITEESASNNTNNKSTNDPNSYMSGHIGLISLHLLEDNSVFINDIIKDSNVLSILHRYTNHMKMCIEPLDNNEMIGQFIIPPINTITGLLKYLNLNFCLYNSGYRFFRDFSTSYLLSMKGNPVETEDYDYNTIVFYICDPSDDKANTTAIEFDTTNKAYVIYVNANSVSIVKDRVASKAYNNIVGVDTLGNTEELAIDLPTYVDSSKKNIIERVPNDNLNLIKNTKNTLESGSTLISIVKNDIDTSIITPNKQYMIKSHNMNREYDGKYVLSSKKEIFYRNTSSFVCTINFALRRAKE